MRARSSRSTPKSGASLRPPGAGRARSISFLTVLFLMLGMLAPFATVQQLSAAPEVTDPIFGRELLQGGSPPLQGVYAVTVGGDVANMVGPVSLSNDGNGIWSGTAPLPSGSYNFSVTVSTNDGDVNAGSSSVNVSDDAAGAVFQFDANTGRVRSGPLLVTLATDYGTFPMIGDGNGNFAVTFDASPGSPVNVETIVGDESTGNTAQPVAGNGGRVRVVADGSGSILQANGIDSAQLTVDKTDDQGEPQPGACFAVMTDGNIASQACDITDGSNDGQTTLNFPNGFPDNGNLVETFTPSGQEIADSEQISLSSGFNQEQLVVRGVGGGEEPSQGEEPEQPEQPEEPEQPGQPEEPQQPEGQAGTLTVYAVDEDGFLLPGACISVDGVGQVCDDDFDGVFTFQNVPFGSYNITATQAPQGYGNAQSTQVDVQGDQQISLTFPSAEQSPVDEQDGTLTIYAVDQDGFLLPGACVSVDGLGQACDDDFDGVITFQNVPLGSYTVTATQAPQGYQNVQPAQVEVQGDQQVSLPFAQAAEQTGSIVATTIDENGQQLPFVCYNISSFGQQCDGDDPDALMTQDDVPPGEYTVELIVPDGYQVIGSTQQQVTVQAGQAANITFQVQTAGPATFDVSVQTVDQNGNVLGGACYQLDDGAQACDDDFDGITNFQNVEAGGHTLTQIQAPDGFDRAAPQQIDVQNDSFVTFTNQETTGEPEATETPSEPEVTPAGPEEEGFSVGLVSLGPDGTAAPGACYSLDDTDQPQCDDDGDGIVIFTGVSAGFHSATMTQAPQGFQNIGAVGIDVSGDQQFAVRLTPSEEQPETGTGTIAASVVDENGQQIPNACFEIVGVASDCDGDDPDALMTEPDVPVGEYTVNLIVPDGYVATGPTSQQVTVTTDETSTVQFQVASEGSEAPVEPTATEESGAQPEVPPTEQPVGPAEGFGSLHVTATDQGFPIIGACISYQGPASGEVCDGDANDADPNQASVLIQDLPAGGYQVSMPNPPQGFDPAPAVNATVSDGQITTVNLESGGVVEEPTETPAPTTGNLTIIKVDENAAPLGGACFTIDGNITVCDNGVGDLDPNAGSILIEDLDAGDVTVSEIQAPDGYLIADPQVVSIPAGGEATAQFIDALAPPPVGSLQIVKSDDTGNLLGGSCWTLTGGESTSAVCDNDANDLDPQDGIIALDNITAGDYNLSESTVPDGYLAVADQTISITEGQRTDLALTNNRATGALIITKTDGDGNALGGACFAVGDRSVCDDGDGDSQNTVPGIIQIDGLTPGDYQIVETQAPDGYIASDDPVGVTIIAGEQATATFQNNRPTGSVEITKVDASDNTTTLGGACFQVGDQTVCDNQDGDGDSADGIILISGVPVGAQTVTETQAPDGYQVAAPVDIVIDTDQTATVTIADPHQSGSLQILKVDAADGSTALAGACFSVDGGAPICDNDAGDADPADGSIVIGELSIGTHQIEETQAPIGYAIATDAQSVDVATGEQATLTFQNTSTQGQIRILKIDQDTGARLAGACFTIDGGLPICDNQEGDLDPADGVVLIDADGGDHQISEVTAPDGYDPVLSPQNVTVTNGEIAEITFENSAFTGTVRITKTDDDTQELLGGACFILTDTVDGVIVNICDNGEGDSDPTDGVILIQGISTGVYDLTESITPDGYIAPEGPVATDLQVTTGEAVEVAVGNEPIGLPTPTPIPVGSVLIDKIDPDGNALAGACFALAGDTNAGPVCDNGPADTDPTDGKIGIANVPAGDYTLSETQAPDGYSQAENQTITVTVGETTQVQVVDQPTTPDVGVLVITVSDESGTALGGACFSWGGTSICDNGIGDEDPAPGRIQISGVQIGSYQIVNTAAPANFAISDAQAAEITANTTTTVDFTLQAAEQETGGLRIELNDDDGNPVEGACVALAPASNVADAAPIVLCDGGAEDTNPEPGVLVVEDLSIGTWTISQTSIPGDGAVQVAGVDFKVQPLQGDTVSGSAVSSNSRTVTVKADVIVVVIIIIIVQPPTEGSLQIVKRAEDTNLLQGGACFQVTGQGSTIEVCDNDGVDQNTTVGVILLTELAEGDYTIHETVAPAGYDPAADQTATVVGGLKTVATIKDPRSNQPATLTILKQDDQGNPVLDTCFELRQGGTTIYAAVCDGDDGTVDGKITFTDVTPDTYVLRETRTAGPNWQPIADQTITIAGGVNPDLVVVNVLKTGAVRITKTNQDGSQPLAGSCFGLDRGNGLEFVTCDNGAGDADPADGIILIKNIPPDDYTLIETQAPVGYDVGPDVAITVQPALTTSITVQNTPMPPPVDTGTLTVHKQDSKGNPLAGACFALKQGNVTRYGPICDVDDGTNDGTITFIKVGVGDYSLVETQKPSADYQNAPVLSVTISKDQTTTVAVKNTLRPGLIQITKTDQKGRPLTGACFKITPGSAPVLCTDGSGQVVFSNLPAGVYTVTETKAPFGYQLAPAVTNVVVNPGLTTPLTIVDKLLPPPPDAGSIKVIKFFCPQTDPAQTAAVYNSSGSQQMPLSITANCKKGDATFSLARKDGTGTPITFSTGIGGEAHLTLQAGVYILTEKETGTKAELTVFVGQQTTVVVLNYVKPPKPAPPVVEVRKYTCDPGFKGQFYLDFINACGSATSLTNGIQVQLAGASGSQTRYTGDTGQAGFTQFTGLVPGNYSLQEKTPAGTSVFAWCGVRLDSYEFGAIGSIINFPLQSGETMYCALFNVPDEVSDTTGTIVVQKYSCALPATKRPANFDWFANCSNQTSGVRFTISQMVNGVYEPRLAGVTDVNGLLKFNDLAPGTYKLQEVGADWCHAESDAVNAQGDVVVQAGKRSSVWIFNCVPTNRPPNTGTGSAAGMVLPGLAPVEGESTGIVARHVLALEMQRRVRTIFS